MKQRILLFLVGTLFFSFVVNSQAQTVSDVQSKKEQRQLLLEQRKEEKQRMLEDMKQRMEEKKASVSARLTERKKANVNMYWNRLYRKFKATISRLNTLISRIETRVSDFQESYPDEDLTEVIESIGNAKEMLLDADTKLEAASESVGTVVASQDPKESFAVVRESVVDIKTELKEIHKILVHVIGDLRGLRVKMGEGDLTTPTPMPEE